ncbi:amidophosphoribosyltransferase [Mucilaginibacter sp. PPCGB 2223]|uniref:ComF family protein n=1 Tax=Mucilaginibacter sp. PPCGB 2223 TaxID=1886027 RepID=UPI000823FDFB|nr:phosphoribosyltransferase family protein [Mucilaginibacter sp. PPCGB 2223]OCX50743.1 amidophosphoribosyltransferase [Mucilaginibacter sp. PPCGB 2223]
MKLRATYLKDFIALIFPQLCQACGNNLITGEELICTACQYDLPYTNFHQQADNVVARQFWGRIDLQSAYVLLYFSKGGRVQNMMHQLKYRNTPKIGNRLGEIAGKQLVTAACYNDIDIIIPVPLHPRKLKQRGYNQSAQFAEGLAQKLNKPVDTVNLIRLKHTDTQTKKSRFLRYENMKDVFGVCNAEQLAGKHILLVDDIITTGSTLEACGLELLKIPGVRVSVAAIAYAE